MIPYQINGVYAGVTFCVLCKILGYFVKQARLKMHNKRRSTLTSIPEKNENEEEVVTKWVPKSKHEALKAKYKCLKKLFQIYDASLIGILPDPNSGYGDGYVIEKEEENEARRREERAAKKKKRSNRTKTDTSAATSSDRASSDELTENSKTDRSETTSKSTTTLSRDFQKCSQISTAGSESFTSYKNVFVNTHDSQTNTNNVVECTNYSLPHYYPSTTIQPMRHPPVPFLRLDSMKRVSRFEVFMQRIFGVRPERQCPNFVLPNGPIYAHSENNIRRRRGIRFRRLGRANVNSDLEMRDGSPIVLSYIQSAQKSCLTDVTPRQCPIVGCSMMFYGIINYNDHLNLSHFIDRKYICNYCHAGYENEFDKTCHENEHIGINKLNTSNNITPLPSTDRQSVKKVSVTQTDPDFQHTEVPDEKLKKIVSFLDKIVDSDQILKGMKENRYSESNLRTSSKTETDQTENTSVSSSMRSKRTLSCGHIMNRKGCIRSSKCESSAVTDCTSKMRGSSTKCPYCDEDFQCRRELSLHVDLEHRVHDRYSRFHHSVAGITCPHMSFCRNQESPRNQCEMMSESGQINVQSTETSPEVTRVNSTSTQESESDRSQKSKSEDELSCDPSTNIVFCNSQESIKKPSLMSTIVQRVKSGINSYKWEPSGKVIRA